MELRRDPLTQSWVVQQTTEETWAKGGACPLCPGNESLCPPSLYEFPQGQPPWQVRVIPHRYPIFQIEGEPERRAEGIYDRMRNLGAHELVIEHPDHNLLFWQLSDDRAVEALRAYRTRIIDLEKDRRFKYVNLFRDVGPEAGQELAHPHSEIIATPFIPRRVAYELNSTQRYYAAKERCLFCDVIKQEMEQQVRTVEHNDFFVAFCPFASRVPYETWILPHDHHHAFEEYLASWDKQLALAKILKSILRRLTSLARAYHMVLHTAPNTHAKFAEKTKWQTLTEDYHWHFEILPVITGKSRSYSLKEVYLNSPPPPEIAATELRAI